MLTDLIAQCNDQISSIYRVRHPVDHGLWCATWQHWAADGKTPEEAVQGLIGILKKQGFL